MGKLKSLLTLIVKQKSYIFFTFFKYLEYGVLAFIFMSFANLVSPEEYGNASLGFQTITYSSFLVLGVNQVLLKKYTLEKKPEIQSFYLQYNALYNVTFALIAVLIVSIFVPRSYSLYLGVICATKLILESAVAVNRVRAMITRINLIYLTTAITFLIFYLIWIYNSYSFFKFWSLSIIVGAVLGWFLTAKFVFFNFSISTFKTYFSRYKKALFLDGVRLAFIAVISPLFSTLGIVFLNAFNDDKALIGNFQLADNISNIIALGGGSILFIIFPDAIKKIDENKDYIHKMYKNGFKALLALILMICIIYYPLQKIIPYFFQEYFDLTQILTYSIILRLLVLFMFIPTVVLITLSLEKVFIKIALLFIIIESFFVYFLLNYGDNAIILNYLIPIQIVIVIIMQLTMRKTIISKL